MERVAFLVESTGARLGCLLNPDSLLLRRAAGIQQRRIGRRWLTGARLADDPLIYTGGGTTELTMDLLFDVSLAGSSNVTEDVRDLTRPLWDLAENWPAQDGYGQPPLVRFVWGKAWNIRGVVASIAGRLEFFTPGGAPRRSWLRMRMLRVDESPTRRPPPRVSLGGQPASPRRVVPEAGVPPERVRVREVAAGGLGNAKSGGKTAGRLDDIAQQEYGDPSQWRLLAAFNNLDDPMHIPAGTLLRIPDLPAIEKTR